MNKRLQFLCAFFLVFAAPLFAQNNAPLEELEARLHNGDIPVNVQNLALLRFKLEQARLLVKTIRENQEGSTWARTQNSGQPNAALEAVLSRAQEVARAQGDAAWSVSTTMQERAYLSVADNSPQPYWVFLPPDYTPEKEWPLVVFLHGYDSSISKINPWIPDSKTHQLATSRGFILAVPYGRRNSDFVGIGEDDTLAVIEEVTRIYNVDSQHTFLLGPSMGGYGVHAIGLHHPDRFAALAPICARTDFYLWFELQRANVPAWKRVLYDADNPRTLKRNAFQLPIYIQHGALDEIVPVEHSRRFAADLQALNFPVSYREIAEGSHFIYWEYSVFERALDWLQKQKRAPVPRRVQYTTGALRTHRVHWVSIEGFQDYSRLAHIDAEIKLGNIIVVNTENVARFRLDLPPEFLEEDVPVTLIVNDLIEPGVFEHQQPLYWPHRNSEKVLDSTRKSPQLAGPIKEIYRDPFLLVYGTLKSGGKDEKNARRFQQEWQDYADGWPPIKADRDVTQEDRERFNLILFGVCESNSLLLEVSEKLPLELLDDGYRLGQQEYFGDAKTLGLQFCYPSPFDERRLIVVQSGAAWGAALPLNHKLDLLPEFIVYDGETFEASDQTNRALAAGFFDDDWNLPENLESPLKKRSKN